MYNNFSAETSGTSDTVVIADSIDIVLSQEDKSKEKPDMEQTNIVEEVCQKEEDNELATEPVLDKFELILEGQALLVNRLDDLNALFKSRIMHTDHEDRVIDQMHKELQKYKEDMYAQLIRPILLDVIEVSDSIKRVAAAYLSKSEGEQAIPNKIFSDYTYDLQDILEKNAVEIFKSNLGDDLFPITQRVIKKVPTKDEALHGKIAESLSSGYNYNGRTISPEKVTVYYYDRPLDENVNCEVDENV